MNLTGFVSVPLFILSIVAFARGEIITIGLVGSIGSLLGGATYYGYEKYKCMYMECCTDEYILSDLDSKYEFNVKKIFYSFFIYQYQYSVTFLFLRYSIF